MTSTLLRRPWPPSLPTNHSILVTLLGHAQLSNSSSSVLWSSVRCNGSSEKQPRPGPQNTHKGQGPKNTLRVTAVSAVCQRWSPGLIGGALIALLIKPSVSVQRSVSCLFACFCCSDTNPSGTNSSTDVFQESCRVLSIARYHLLWLESFVCRCCFEVSMQLSVPSQKNRNVFLGAKTSV